MKLATWNVNSLTVRLPQVLDWLQTNPVDVLALQELKMTDDKFPSAVFAQAGYYAQWFGQKTYNGVALLSRTPAAQVVKNIPGFDDDMARVIAGTLAPDQLAADAATGDTAQNIRVIGAYFPNGQEPGSDKFDYKLAWLKGLRDWVRQELLMHPNLVLSPGLQAARNQGGLHTIRRELRERSYVGDGAATDVTHVWRVRPARGWMRALSPLLAPAFRWNHDGVMRAGEAGLRAHLRGAAGRPAAGA